MVYDLFAVGEKALNSRRLAGVLEDCAAQLVRFDERLNRAEPRFQKGFRERHNYFEAQGLVGLQGSLVHLEDLVLYDLNSLSRIPDEDVHLGAAALTLRRWLDKQSGRALLGAEALERMTGQIVDSAMHHESDEDAMLRGLIDDVDRAMRGESAPRQRDLKDALASLESLPVMLGAVLLLDYFLSSGVASKKGAGFVLCSAYLRARGLVRYHLPTVARAAWRGRYQYHAEHDLERRLLVLTQVIEQSARLAMDDMNRLSLAHDAMMARAAILRKGSRLKDVIDLFIAHPALSIEAIALKLRVTSQAVEHMLKKQLGGTRPPALSEQKRYQTFGIL